MNGQQIAGILLEAGDEDLRRLARSAGALPPYRDLDRVTSAHMRRFPEFESFKLDPYRIGGGDVSCIMFRSRSKWSPGTGDYRGKHYHCWWATVVKAEDDYARSTHSLPPGNIILHLGFGGPESSMPTSHKQSLKPEIDDFVARLRKLIDIDYIGLPWPFADGYAVRPVTK